jgi:hypothetical protein
VWLEVFLRGAAGTRAGALQRPRFRKTRSRRSGSPPPDQLATLTITRRLSTPCSLVHAAGIAPVQRLRRYSKHIPAARRARLKPQACMLQQLPTAARSPLALARERASGQRRMSGRGPCGSGTHFCRPRLPATLRPVQRACGVQSTGCWAACEVLLRW